MVTHGTLLVTDRTQSPALAVIVIWPEPPVAGNVPFVGAMLNEHWAEACPAANTRTAETSRLLKKKTDPGTRDLRELKLLNPVVGFELRDHPDAVNRV